MRLRSAGLYATVLAVISSAQTPYNGFSHGIVLDGADASSLAQGSSGLVPSFDSRFSVSNPSTWQSLRFAYLTTHYGTGRIEYRDRDFASDFGLIRNITFIVPVKGEFAWGMGLIPYSRKRFIVESETDSVFFSGKNLSVSEEIDGAGGISSLFIGGSWRIDDRKAVGARIDFLFGVFDEVISSYLDAARSALFRRQFQYRATLVSLYYTLVQSKSTFYFGGQFPIGEREIVLTHYHLFKDVDRSRISFSLPVTGSLGWVYQVTDKTHLNVEVLVRTFPGEIDEKITSLPVKHRQRTESRVNLGILREGVSTSRNFLDRFHYHFGFIRREHYISRPNGPLTEQGISAGIGIPFGPTVNQIDIGVRFSKREGFLSNEPEFVRQVAVGLTLGDLWLLKRRRK